MTIKARKILRRVYEVETRRSRETWNEYARKVVKKRYKSYMSNSYTTASFF